jgi:hypothetical protein
MINYFVTEADELDDEFVNESKYYTAHILKYEEELQLVFRIRTAGLDGWTEYGIAVWKVNEDFACRE